MNASYVALKLTKCGGDNFEASEAQEMLSVIATDRTLRASYTRAVLTVHIQYNIQSTHHISLRKFDDDEKWMPPS